jgi:hypothetical protein
MRQSGTAIFKCLHHRWSSFLHYAQFPVPSDQVRGHACCGIQGKYQNVRVRRKTISVSKYYIAQETSKLDVGSVAGKLHAVSDKDSIKLASNVVMKWA